MPPKTRERPGANRGALRSLSHQPSATGTSVPPPSLETRLEAALDYLARGWALLPIRPGHKEPYGRLLPLGKWESLAEHAATEDDVRSWFADCPEINLGILAGDISQRLALVDIDYGKKPNSNAATAPDALLDYVASLDTPVVWTPSGGLHLYARSARLAELGNLKRDLTGTTVEIKARKGYVLAPPSAVRSGSYRFAKALEDLTLASVEEVLADLAALFSQLSQPNDLRGKTRPVLPLSAVERRSRKGVASKAKPENQREARGLERSDADPEFVEAVISLLGISARVDWNRGASSKFRCVMHREQNPSASLFRTESGVWMYADHHQRDGRQVYPLVDVYARVKYGVRRKLTRNQRAKWKLRLLADTRRLSVYLSDLEVPKQPDDLSADAAKALLGFVRLQAMTWADRPAWRGNPAAFARDFAARWCGLPESRRFDRARDELVGKGLLVPVDECAAGSKGRTTKLFNLPAYVRKGA